MTPITTIIQETCLSGGDVIYAQKRVISYYD